MEEKSINYLSSFVPYIPNEDPLYLRIRQYTRQYGDEATKAAMRRARKGIRGQVEFSQQESDAFACKTLMLLRGMPSVNWMYR